MALPSSFLAALAGDAPALDMWLEIEGLPFGYGLVAHSPSTDNWANQRTGRYVRQAIRACLRAIPGGIEAEARPLEGDSSVGQMVVELLDDGIGLSNTS